MNVMDAIVITQWALDTYLDLKHSGAIAPSDYKETLRPDVLLLKNYPGDPKFANQKFWSPATLDQHRIEDAYKMKWHNFGSRSVQLRLPVGLGLKPKELAGMAFLLHAYVKSDPKQEKRELLKLQTRLELIRRNQYTERGRLT